MYNLPGGSIQVNLFDLMPVDWGDARRRVGDRWVYHGGSPKHCRSGAEFAARSIDLVEPAQWTLSPWIGATACTKLNPI